MQGQRHLAALLAPHGICEWDVMLASCWADKQGFTLHRFAVNWDTAQSWGLTAGLTAVAYKAFNKL